MSLAIAFKGSEGIVLAADSRVTLHAQIPNSPILLPATYDNATKLFEFKKQKHVGAVTFGSAIIGQSEPRTAHSYLPELEANLTSDRLSVLDFAQKLSLFFLTKWNDGGMPSAVPPGQEMVFVVGGYDQDAPYGRIFDFNIPTNPNPIEKIPSPQFGAVWGGQKEIVERLVCGFDLRAVELARKFLSTPLLPIPPSSVAQSPDPLLVELQQNLRAKIPWQFLPLQDCIDLSIFLIKTTIVLQKWLVDIRGVGGHIDVATITPLAGFSSVQRKRVSGENL